jgi:predicted kinase
MPTVHLIHGYLGAGKTTFAKKLAEEVNGVQFNPDEWMARLYGEDPPAYQFAERLDRVFALLDDQWVRVVRCGVDVVLDYGFWTRAARDAARQQAAAAGASCRLYALQCLEATARARCLRRNANLQGSLCIADNTFDVLQSRFEPLQADEPHLLMNTEQRLSKNLQDPQVGALSPPSAQPALTEQRPPAGSAAGCSDRR